jgi:hypothetical protein
MTRSSVAAPRIHVQGTGTHQHARAFDSEDENACLIAMATLYVLAQNKSKAKMDFHLILNSAHD